MEHTLETLDVYLLAEDLSDPIWNMVVEWDAFAKDTVGKQLVRAADSIAANIAEGYGRFHYKESKQFYFYARGSIQETKAWIGKCKRRKLIGPNEADAILQQAATLLLKLNAYIKFVAQSSVHNRPMTRSLPDEKQGSSKISNPYPNPIPNS